MADIRLGNNNTVYKVGSGDCTIYLGTTLLYSGGTPTHDYSLDYLTFTAIESGTFKFSGNSVNYSIDSGSTWTSLASNTNSPTVNQGDKILWKARLTPGNNGIGRFSSTGQFDVEGNVMSLLYGDNFIGQTDLTGKNYAFMNLFSGCTGMTSAENISLPATTLSNSCYESMFRRCTALTTVPSELPALTMKNNCYLAMFEGCTSLVTVPYNMLPATIMAESCYYATFWNCTNLTTSPMLPATTLADKCYREIFRSTKVSSVTCLATDISANSCTYWWLNATPSSGTFTKAASMTSWGSGDSGIPNNWTVVDYTG